MGVSNRWSWETLITGRMMSYTAFLVTENRQTAGFVKYDYVCAHLVLN